MTTEKMATEATQAQAIAASSIAISDIQQLSRAGVDTRATPWYSSAESFKFSGSKSIVLNYFIREGVQFTENAMTLFSQTGSSANFRIDYRPDGRIAATAGGSFEYIPVAAGNWHQFIINYNATTGVRELWVDGALCSSFTSSDPLGTAEDMYIGSLPNGTQRMDGVCGGLAVMKTAISPNRCRMFFNDGKIADLDRLNWDYISWGVFAGVGLFLPSTITPNWLNTAGSDNLSPLVTYSWMPAYGTKADATVLKIKTGVFTDDISTTEKTLRIPAGYYVDKVVVRNYNDNLLTNLKIREGNGSELFVSEGAVSAANSIMVTGYNICNSAGAFITKGISYHPSLGNVLAVTATGNGAEGMEVIAIVRPHMTF